MKIMGGPSQSPTFGELWRLVSKNGKNDGRFEKKRIEFIESFHKQNGLYRIASFQPPNEEWPYLAISHRQHPEPVAEQYIDAERALFLEMGKLFPNDKQKGEDWYCKQAQSLAQQYAGLAQEQKIL
jgi:hypothetical protein